MAIAELGIFISEKLDKLPKDDQERALLEGIFIVVDAYNKKPLTGITINDKDNDLTKKLQHRKFIQQLKESGLPTRTQTTIDRGFRQGEIRDLEEIRSFPNVELLRWRGIGSYNLGEIRKRFPYEPLKTSEPDTK